MVDQLVENMKQGILDQQVLRYFHELAKAEQLDALNFLKTLVAKRNDKNKALLQLAGSIPIDDLQRMEQAIKDCERIDKDEW